MNEPASQGCEPFSVRHERFRNTLEPLDWEEFSASSDDKQKIRFVYERLYNSETFGDDNEEINNSGKDGDAALKMKKTGTGYFQKSDHQNALNWYSLAALHCPHTEGTPRVIKYLYAK